MKTCGVVGGMGPEATAIFYMKLVKLFVQGRGYPPVLIYSAPEPFLVAEGFLQSSRDDEVLKKLVIEGVGIIDDKVDFCVIPCNTAHLYIDEIRRVSKVPVFSIVEETCKHLQGKKVQSIGILATTASIQNQLYSKQLYEHTIVPVVPLEEQQAMVAEVICRLVKGEVLSTDKAKLLAIMESLRQRGAEGIILGCTELPILLSREDAAFPVFDTMDILAEVAKNAITGERALHPGGTSRNPS